MNTRITYIGTLGSNEPLCLSMAGRTAPADSDTIRRPRDTELMVLQYITVGKGYVFHAGRRHTAMAGDFFIVPRQREHYYYPDIDDPWGKAWLNLTGNLLEELLRIYGLAEQYFFPGCREAGAVVEEVVEAAETLPRADIEEYLSRRMLELVLTLVRFCRREKQGSAPRNEKAWRLREFLRTRITGPSPGVEEMGKVISLSPIQAIRVFREEFGITPYAYLLNEKINMAGEILTSTGNSIRETAELFGFSNEYYFSRVFKQKKGIPPGEYRRRNLRGDSPPR